MLAPIAIRLIGYSILLFFMMYIGWYAHDVYDDSQELLIEQAKKEFLSSYQASEQNQANILQNKLDQLHANERIVNHEITKIVNRDVYHNVCIDADGLRTIESARTGQADTSKSSE